jgi:hypothetical protein
VSPVKYELEVYIPEDDLIHSELLQSDIWRYQMQFIYIEMAERRYTRKTKAVTP